MFAIIYVYTWDKQALDIFGYHAIIYNSISENPVWLLLSQRPEFHWDSKLQGNFLLMLFAILWYNFLQFNLITMHVILAVPNKTILDGDNGYRKHSFLISV